MVTSSRTVRLVVWSARVRGVLVAVPGAHLGWRLRSRTWGGGPGASVSPSVAVVTPVRWVDCQTPHGVLTLSETCTLRVRPRPAGEGPVWPVRSWNGRAPGMVRHTLRRWLVRPAGKLLRGGPGSRPRGGPSALVEMVGPRRSGCRRRCDCRDAWALVAVSCGRPRRVTSQRVPWGAERMSRRIRDGPDMGTSRRWGAEHPSRARGEPGSNPTHPPCGGDVSTVR